MKKLYVFPYKQGSASAKTLARALDTVVIKRENSSWKKGAGKTVINWGSSSLPPHVAGAVVINGPEAVADAANKLSTFNILHEKGVPIPQFTTDKQEAIQWSIKGKEVVVRHKLSGHSGEGVEIIGHEDNLDKWEEIDAPLYVEYIPKKHEYRTHIVNRKIVDVQRKARKADVENPNWKIRNHANGFIYAREVIDDNVRNAVGFLGACAVDALCLDFGAVDIIYNEKKDAYYVLEVNTACGLEGSTVDKYADAFKEWLL